MDFKSLSIIKQPQDKVWQTMRDHLIDVARHVDDIDSITLHSRQEMAPDAVEIVNIWKANPPIPDSVARYIDSKMLMWTDTAHWDSKTGQCSWTIQSHYFKDKMHCQGQTIYEPALGGRGCRITFQGDIQWEKGLPLSLGLMDDLVSKALESIIGKVIPNNFRKLTGHLEKYIVEELL